MSLSLTFGMLVIVTHAHPELDVGLVSAVLLGWRDDVAARGGGGRGGGEHGGRGDHPDLRHADAVVTRPHVPIVHLVTAGRHPLVGVN